jgi:hypothetical protein
LDEFNTSFLEVESIPAQGLNKKAKKYRFLALYIEN